MRLHVFAKITVISFAAFCCGIAAKATPVMIWSADSSSAFDVTIQDSTSVGLNQTVISPSGLWRMYSNFDIGHYSSSLDVLGYLRSTAFFLGPSVGIPPGIDYPPFGYSIYPKGSTISAGSSSFAFNAEGWRGAEHLTAIPTEGSSGTTWSYTLRIYAQGPDLAINVPDNGSTIALLGLALASIAAFRRRIAFRS